MSVVDQLLRRVLITSFFSRGWGSLEQLERMLKFRLLLGNRERLLASVPEDYEVIVDKVEKDGTGKIIHGHFTSPMVHVVPNILPPESETAHFQLLVPDYWSSQHKPLCIHLAATGDHSFKWRRHRLGYPLLKEAGIGSLLLDNPFYGCRKPPSQLRSGLLHVTDLFALGGALVLESLVLLRWCEKKGYGPLGISGVSMGGHNACLAASVWPKPLAIIPCLSGTTASKVFTQGALARACRWKYLRAQMRQHELQAGMADLKAYLTQTLTSIEWCAPSRLLYTPGQVIDSSDQVYKDDSWSSLLRRDVEQLRENFSPTFFFMQWLMNQMTHLSLMEQPLSSSSIIAVLARHDEYVPSSKYTDILKNVWPNCEVRYVDGGHIYSSLFQYNAFRQAIKDAFTNMS